MISTSRRMLPVQQVGYRQIVYFYIHIYCDQQNSYVPGGGVGKAMVIPLRKKTEFIRLSTKIEKRQSSYNCSIYLYSSYKITIIELYKI